MAAPSWTPRHLPRLLVPIRLSIRSVIAIPLFGISLLSGPTAFAQIELPDFGLGIRGVVGSGPCDSEDICHADSGVPQPGIYQIDVYAGNMLHSVDGLRVGLDLPEGWTVLSYEFCNAELTEGDPYEIESGVELVTEGCWDGSHAILTLVVDCASPSAAYIRALKGETDPWIRDCGSQNFRMGYPGYVEQRVNVGDFCGRMDFGGPCEFCELTRSARFSPSSLSWTLAPGGTATSTLQVWGTRDLGCGILPECGGFDYDDADCFSDLRDGPDWLTATYLYSEGYFRHYYDLEVDAGALSAGTYPERIWAGSGCPYCEPMCLAVQLEVLGPADVDGPERAGGLALVVSQNPSGGVLACSLRLPSSGWVRVSLFDTNGGRVQTLWDGAREVGTHVLRAELSEDMPRGLYFLRAETAREVVHQKVTFLTR